MTRHRGHNEGTIAERTHTRKDGTKRTRYMALAPIDHNGKRPSLGTFDTRAAAREAITKAGVAQAQGFAVAGKIPTVKQWCEGWLAGRTSIAYATRRGYECALPVMYGYVGHLRLDAITEQDIASMWAKLLGGEAADGTRRARLSLTTLRKYHTYLKAALGAAVRSRHIPIAWNPAAAEEARPERGERRAINPLTEDEVRRLFAVTRSRPEHALFVVLITTGMRPGEAQGLGWADVDLERRRLAVQRSIHRETGKGYVVGPTKTRKNRSVELRPETVGVLRSHRVQQAEARLAAGPLWQDQGLVFTDELGGPFEQKRMERAFHRFCRDAGIERRSLKECRHTFATLALIHGVPAKVVQEALGHSSIAITLDIYSHLMPDLQGDSLGHLDSLFA